MIMYLTRDALRQLFSQVASLPHVTLACSFILPIEPIAEEAADGNGNGEDGRRRAVLDPLASAPRA